MADDTEPSSNAAPLRRREIFRTVRGARLSASRGRPAQQLPQQYTDATLEAPEVYARRPYSEPND
jgi:hypothetical protein